MTAKLLLLIFSWFVSTTKRLKKQCPIFRGFRGEGGRRNLGLPSERVDFTGNIFLRVEKKPAMWVENKEIVFVVSNLL
jgi:hypothetical protein